MASDFLGWFERWKEVIAAGVAILGIIFVVLQIRQAGRFERDRIRREQAAARATLPLTLATLTEYGSDMIRALLPLESWLSDRGQGAAPTFNGPHLLPETVAAVEKVIAAYPYDREAKALAIIMGEVQVLQSRTRGFASGEDNIRSWSVAMRSNIVMAAGVVARCEALFDFAREVDDPFEPNKVQVQSALNRARAYQHLFPSIWEAVDKLPEPKVSAENGRIIRLIPGLFRRAN